VLRSLVIKIEYRRALHESSGKLHLPESSRLHEFVSAHDEFISAHAKLNRQTREIERPVTPRKQTTAARSNRQIFQKCGLLLLVLACGSFLAQARFRQPNSEYQARRAKLRSTINGPAVLFGYTSHQDAGELAVFFQEENFYYLTGHSEPDAALLLIPDSADGKSSDSAHEILYLPPRNPGAEEWGGPKMGPSDPGIAEETGFQAVEPFANLRADLVNLAKTYSTFYTELPPKQENGYPHLTIWSGWVRSILPQSTIDDVAPALASLRQIKSAGEIALIQKAVDASVDAHIAAMKMMRPGLFEYQIAARMKEVHEMEGCSREAYAPIVGTGFYSTVLHYDALKNEIKDGDVVVIDVAGEYGGYAADITRTLPANGKFTARQREIYEIVLGAQNAALAAIKPGVMLIGGPKSVHQVAYEYINTHGHDLHGNTLGRYFFHGVGHHLGLDVHDPNDRSPLQAGMVITDEPGIYIPEENIGVRIEDDVLVTPDGNQLLSAKLPRSPDEIEKIMAEGRAQSQSQPQP
jgi:Xaa-Pro aminopeptidase